MTTERQALAFFDKMPENRNLPDDIFLMEELKSYNCRIPDSEERMAGGHLHRAGQMLCNRVEGE